MINERSPSQTALRIAGNRVAAATDPVLRRVVAHPDEPYSRWFIDAGPVGMRLQIRAWTWGPLRRLLYAITNTRTPGAPLYLLLRKRYVEDAVRKLLQECPAEQVVVF